MNLVCLHTKQCVSITKINSRFSRNDHDKLKLLVNITSLSLPCTIEKSGRKCARRAPELKSDDDVLSCIIYFTSLVNQITLNSSGSRATWGLSIGDYNLESPPRAIEESDLVHETSTVIPPNILKEKWLRKISAIS